MNDKLEEFRKRLREPEKKKSDWRFWIGSPTAWLGLVVSLTTAFYTFFYYSDQLSVVMPLQESANDDKEVVVSLPQTVTFINSGTRPISILGVNFRLLLPHPPKPPPGEPPPSVLLRPDPPYVLLPPTPPPEPQNKCRLQAVNPIMIPAAFAPTVVKPFDTVIWPVRLSDHTNPVKLPLSDKLSLDDLPFVVCMDFKFIATESPVLASSLEVNQSWVADLSHYNGTGSFLSYWGPEKFIPKYLIKRNRLWTDVEAEVAY